MSSVVKLRRARRGQVAATVRVTPDKPGHQPLARIVGRVENGKLVSANGIRWKLS